MSFRKIEYEGETYYYLRGRFLDASFIEVPANLRDKLTKFYFLNVDYKALPPLDALHYLIDVKDSGMYDLSIQVGEYLLEAQSNNLRIIKIVVPILMSSYRQFEQPVKAIKLFYEYSILHPEIVNSVWLTPLASAYLDTRNIAEGIKYAILAYEKQGDKYRMTALTVVFERIKFIINRDILAELKSGKLESLKKEFL